MTGWLSRGLLAVALGAVLAFAVTLKVEQFDIQNAGAIVLFAGLGYLLVHLGLLGWARGWGAKPAPPRPYQAGRDVDRERYRRLQQDWAGHSGHDDPQRTRVMPPVREWDDR
jgi:hypothetical protein